MASGLYYASGQDVWHAWTTSASCGTATNVWQSWTETSSPLCGTYSNSAPTIWLRWNTASAASGCTTEIRTPCYAYHPAPETEEQKTARLALEAQRQAEFAAAEKKRREEQEEADRRAEKILREHLDTNQRKEYKANAAFHVVTADGKRYRLKKGWAGNVEEIDAAGKAIARYCIHPRESVPHDDNLLAQKLLLETDEREFRRIANRTVLAG